MATLLPNIFSSYELTKEEEQAGSTLTTANQQSIQNLIATSAQLKVNLTYDPESPLKFMQEEARLNGEIGILTYLLEVSRAVNPSLTL